MILETESDCKCGFQGKWKWSQVKQGGSKPSPRSGMSIVTGAANKAYLFGGVCDDEDEESIKSQCMNDFYLLETDKGVWRNLELRQEVSEVAEFMGKSVASCSCILLRVAVRFLVIAPI